ncbi:SDR family NAD(P)-dependent oxidoreductase [Micromonospora purpureochromogenes]|uniref:SDR family NAD(P)-dependent oxidoreductase n=1 Tax=Micromonospora purpureochromogenes TaxID=47872 RepID=UPI0033F46D7F
MTDDRTAVVTGANRGIGLAVVQQLLDGGFVTVLACRDTGRGEAAAATLTPAPGRVLVRRLDVGDDDSVRAFAAGLADGCPVAEGAASVLWAVDLPDDGPNGGFFRDGRPVPW